MGQKEFAVGPTLAAFAQYTGYVLAALSVWIAARCARAMLLRRGDGELWGYLENAKGEKHPLRHWEIVIGRSPGSDVAVSDPAVRPSHAALQRAGDGTWTVTELGDKGPVYVGGKAIHGPTPIKPGKRIKLGNTVLRLLSPNPSDRSEEKKRPTGSSGTLILLWLFQLTLMLQQSAFAPAEHRWSVVVAFVLLMAVEWSCFFLERGMALRSFEPEIIGFYLTTVGFSVAATSTPGAMAKQAALFLGAVGLFFALGLWLRDLDRVRATRKTAGAAALLLLALTLVMSPTVFGAKNWLIVAGRSLQPSEFVKIAYIYAGAAALDTLYRRRELIPFIVFSAACVGALALMGDFGTALVFFITFLVISFMRSGSVATVLLAVSAAAIGVMLVLTVRPYVAARFAGWGHVWEDPLGAGFQQVRAMSAMASGGLFGRGGGNGWLRDVVAADTDLVFGVVCEELGLIAGVCCVLEVVLLALYSVRCASAGRSAYTAIAACAAATVYLTQVGLNVFGSMDLLPFTGVTFPFVSRGGSSLIACWGLLAFVKAADAERNSSFAKRPAPAKKAPAKKPAADKKPASTKKTAPAKKPAAGKGGGK